MKRAGNASPAGSTRCSLVRSPKRRSQEWCAATDQRQPRRADSDQPRRRARRCDAPQARPIRSAAASPCAACSKTSGASVAKSPGEAACDQATTACGSLSNRSASARSKPVAAMRPSSAQSRRRTASQPSQAPLPSSEIGIPQPPTRWVCPRTTAQPTVPVPATMTPPSRSPCAPRQAACASVVIDRPAERMRIGLRSRQVARLAGAGKRQTGHDVSPDTTAAVRPG